MNTDVKKESQAGNKYPRLAMINSMAGYGGISTCVALPVISAMKVQVCPVPTSILSNHLAFPVCHYQDFTPQMRDYIGAWKSLELSFDGLYCGFLGSVEQMEIVEDFLGCFAPPLFLLDPVMGDNGKAYSTITPEHIAYMRSLIGKAHIITPNITEACLLTNTPYKDSAWNDEELSILCNKLSALTSSRIVITGLEKDGLLMNFLWQNGKASTYCVPKAGRSRHGTGDLFASIIVAATLNGMGFDASVKKAADFISVCIQGSEEADIPPLEGVCFERYLYQLIDFS